MLSKNISTFSWIKRDQLGVTCFFISLFIAQRVSGVNTSILRSSQLICWVISWVVFFWYDACWCHVVVWLGWCGVVFGCRLQPYLMLNMFRMLIHPSSGACDLFVELFHGLYCSGTMRVGVTLWFGWGGVVSLCRLKHCFSLDPDTTPPQPNHNVTPTRIVPEKYNPWNNSTN